MSWVCTIHKVQALSLREVVVSSDLQTQIIFKSGQMCVALNQATNIQGLFLTGSLKQDDIKANNTASQEYGRLRNEALFISPAAQHPLPTTLSVTLLNRSLKKHAADTASGLRLMTKDISFLTEPQLSPSSDVNEIQTFLDQLFQHSFLI